MALSVMANSVTTHSFVPQYFYPDGILLPGRKNPAGLWLSSPGVVGSQGQRMHPCCLACLCETSRHLIAALFEVCCLFL